MGTIFGILFLAAVIYEGIKIISEGLSFASDGSGGGCLCAILGLVVGAGFLSLAATAPIGFIIIALIIIALAKK